MRIVLDTNVLARAASGPPGLANEVVLASTTADHSLLLSPFLLSELSRVLRYERLRSIHGLSDAEIDHYVTDLQAVAEIVIPTTQPAAIVADDPDDDPIVATALAGNADVLCTRDRHLLHPDVIAYCRLHGIEVLSDAELLARLRA